jgi:hypothetical protein
MLAQILHRVHDLADAAVRAIRRRLGSALRPATTSSLVLGTAADLMRSRTELVAENALLRHQLIVLARSTKRPRISRSDRTLLVLLASRVRAWRQALLIIQPATLMRWHRAGFRLVWRWRSTPRSRQPRVPQQTVDLIRWLARENRLWGAERIRVRFGHIVTRSSSPTSCPGECPRRRRRVASVARSASGRHPRQRSRCSRTGVGDDVPEPHSGCARRPARGCRATSTG